MKCYIGAASGEHIVALNVVQNIKFHISVTILGTKRYEIKSLLLITVSFNLQYSLFLMVITRAFKVT